MNGRSFNIVPTPITELVAMTTPLEPISTPLLGRAYPVQLRPSFVRIERPPGQDRRDASQPSLVAEKVLGEP